MPLIIILAPQFWHLGRAFRWSSAD